MNEHARELANERVVAARICRILDDGTEQLPWRVSQRLATARAQALSRVVDPAPVDAGRGATRAGNLQAGARRDPRGASMGWSLRRRMLATALPIAMMLVGFVFVDIAQQEQSATDLLEVDSALLTDELPLVAYADRGFGVFIKNTRQ